MVFPLICMSHENLKKDVIKSKVNLTYYAEYERWSNHKNECIIKCFIMIAWTSKSVESEDLLASYGKKNQQSIGKRHLVVLQESR